MRLFMERVKRKDGSLGFFANMFVLGKVVWEIGVRGG